MKGEMAKRYVFLDRDGVINKDSPDYVKSWAEFEFLPGSLDAIRLLTEQGFYGHRDTNWVRHLSK